MRPDYWQAAPKWNDAGTKRWGSTMLQRISGVGGEISYKVYGLMGSSLLL